MTFVQCDVRPLPSSGVSARVVPATGSGGLLASLALLLALGWSPTPARADASAGYLDLAAVQAALAPIAALSSFASSASGAPPVQPDSVGPGSDPVVDATLVAAALFAPIAAPDPWKLAAGAEAPAASACPPLLNHTYTRLQGGQPQSLCDFRGKVLLVVNTASQCGYTYQYAALEALYRRYRDRGLVVAGFPSNDFGGQEPGTNGEIAEFCRTAYGIQFPMFEKSSVKGGSANPFFDELAARTGERPRWNFHKYLIDRRGERVASFGSGTEPDGREIVSAIERLLAEPPAPRQG